MDSLTSGEIIQRALSGKRLTKDEILELYADAVNWVQDYNGPNGSCRWIWKGPVFCAYEAARWALEEGKS